jgi:hypothetical protein
VVAADATCGVHATTSIAAMTAKAVLTIVSSSHVEPVPPAGPIVCAALLDAKLR